MIECVRQFELKKKKKQLNSIVYFKLNNLPENIIFTTVISHKVYITA